MKFFVILAIAAMADAQWLPGECGGSQYGDAGEGQSWGADPEPGLQIVNGVVARDNELPYQVSLEDGNFHFCGGSILNARYVITASHCTSGLVPSEVTIVLGKKTRTGPGARYDTSAITMHENYRPLIIQNDIALLQTTTDMTFDDTARPICAPGANDYNGAELMVSGWGTVSYGGIASMELRYTAVYGMTNAECMQLGYYPGDITDDMLCCHSSESRDACQGDSGGPLVFKRNGVFELVGVVSWGEGCASKPGVYCGVPYMMPWITANAV